jgi:hypothetical protein
LTVPSASPLKTGSPHTSMPRRCAFKPRIFPGLFFCGFVVHDVFIQEAAFQAKSQ